MGTALVSVFLVASVVTILPALGFLFYLLNRYEGYFEDARVFFSLTVGFFVGMVVAFLETVAFRFGSTEFIQAAGLATAFFFSVAGNAFVEAAAKTAVLGTAKFRKRKDTPYYGAALGIGFGAMVALMEVARRFTLIEELGWAFDAPTATVVLLILAFAFAAILVHGAGGVWIGKGSADGKLWRGMGQGSLVQMPVLAFAFVGTFEGRWTAIVAAGASVVYAIAIVLYTQRHILDKVVPPEIRDMVLKERRREARREERAATSQPEPAPPEREHSDL